MVRTLYFGGGLLCIALGVLGAFLPVLPTVPFLLLAAFCFTRSRPEWAERLYAHPRYGPAMREWRDRRAISRRAKTAAIATMAAGAIVTWFTIGWPWAGGVAAILCCTATWIWTRAE